jgi:hypothetical protein
MKNLGTIYPTVHSSELIEKTSELRKEAKEKNFPIIRQKLGKDNYRFTIEKLGVTWKEDLA